MIMHQKDKNCSFSIENIIRKEIHRDKDAIDTVNNLQSFSNSNLRNNLQLNYQDYLINFINNRKIIENEYTQTIQPKLINQYNLAKDLQINALDPYFYAKNAYDRRTYDHKFQSNSYSKCYRRRKARTVFSDLQLNGLESRFDIQRYLSTPGKDMVSK
ncbi:hypothetical protein A3Q56_01585 [Intoshia linei]|uniref:Uncharacterized protein n=1 Tax=Intoshia linei TaxID=1819745 RepID=A0A177B8M4_9BILA|nr:hypothetical protein A3Q56_01585 [Intoshia linei]